MLLSQNVVIIKSVLNILSSLLHNSSTTFLVVTMKRHLIRFRHILRSVFTGDFFLGGVHYVVARNISFIFALLMEHQHSHETWI